MAIAETWAPVAECRIRPEAKNRLNARKTVGAAHLFFLRFLARDVCNVRSFLTKARSALRSSLFHFMYVAQSRFRARLIVLI